MYIIDSFAFCQNGEERTGKLILSDLARLRAECVSDEGEVQWTLVGSMGSKEHPGFPTLHLIVSGHVQLLCQRCLTPYVFQLKSDAEMLLAKDEETADQLESFLSDEGAGSAVEVIVGSKTFDVVALIEDEALLAIPLSPKHEVCPDSEKLDAFVTAKKESPFAALKDRLK